MRDVHVRAAYPGDRSDVAALASLRRAWADEEAGEPVDDPGFDERLAEWIASESRHRLFWLAFLDDRPVGFVAALHYRRMPKPGRPASGWAHVGHLFVVHDQRDHGVGRRLLDAVVEWARVGGLWRLVLSPSERSRPFYARAGFRSADELLVLPLVRPAPPD